MNQSSTDQICQLFIDTRDGVGEEGPITIPYSGQTEFVFPLDGFRDLLRLCLKPLNQSVVLKFGGFEVTTERDGTVALTPSESNASAIVGEIYYFAAHEPQLAFDLSGLVGGAFLSARATMEFLHRDRQALESTVILLESSNQELGQRLQAAEQRVLELEQLNRGLDELLLDAHYRVLQFETSKVWRWTAPLRAMAEAIRGIGR